MEKTSDFPSFFSKKIEVRSLAEKKKLEAYKLLLA